MTTVASTFTIWRTGRLADGFQGSAGSGAHRRYANSDTDWAIGQSYRPVIGWNFTGNHGVWQSPTIWTATLGFYNFEVLTYGEGNPAAGAATVAGTAESSSSASGSPDASAASVVGTAISESIANGVLAASSATVAGTALVESGISGSGTPDAQSATVSGSAISSSSASGALATSAADVTGTGLSASIAIGNLFASAAQAGGVSLSSSIANGALVAGSAQVSGSGFVGTPPVGGTGRLNSMLIMIGIRIN